MADPMKTITEIGGEGDAVITEFQSLFDGSVVPIPNTKGDWGGSTGGDTSGAFGAAGKGVEGIMPEVTYVDLPEAPAYGGGKAPVQDIAGHSPSKDFPGRG